MVDENPNNRVAIGSVIGGGHAFSPQRVGNHIDEFMDPEFRNKHDFFDAQGTVIPARVGEYVDEMTRRPNVQVLTEPSKPPTYFIYSPNDGAMLVIDANNAGDFGTLYRVDPEKMDRLKRQLSSEYGENVRIRYGAGYANQAMAGAQEALENNPRTAPLLQEALHRAESIHTNGMDASESLDRAAPVFNSLRQAGRASGNFAVDAGLGVAASAFALASGSSPAEAAQIGVDTINPMPKTTDALRQGRSEDEVFDAGLGDLSDIGECGLGLSAGFVVAGPAGALVGCIVSVWVANSLSDQLKEFFSSSDGDVPLDKVRDILPDEATAAMSPEFAYLVEVQGSNERLEAALENLRDGGAFPDMLRELEDQANLYDLKVMAVDDESSLVRRHEHSSGMPYSPAG